MPEQSGDDPRWTRIEEHKEAIFRIQRETKQERESFLLAQVVHREEMREIQKRTDETFQALAEAEARRDQALAALMDTLDRFQKRAGSTLT